MNSRTKSLARLVLGALLLGLPACVPSALKQPSAAPSSGARPASPSPTASAAASPLGNTEACATAASVGEARHIPARLTPVTGDTLAFVRDRSIFVLPSGGQPTMLVRNVDAEFLSWSPTADRLTYIACSQELRVLDLARGIDRTVLVDILYSQQVPGFSGDGQRVYGVVSTPQPQGLLDVAVGVDLSTGSTVRVPMPPTFGARGGAPVPVRSVQGSRAGREVAWSAAPSPPQILVFEPTGQVKLRRSGYGPPAWRPTADQLVYSIPGRGLILLDVSSGSERVLDPAEGMNPVWSPDGRRIAYVKMVSNTPTVYVIDAASAMSARLVREPADFPTWSADGQWIAYERQTQTGSSGGYWHSLGLSEVRADGSGISVQLTPDDGSFSPVFAPMPPGP